MRVVLSEKLIGTFTPIVFDTAMREFDRCVHDDDWWLFGRPDSSQRILSIDDLLAGQAIEFDAALPEEHVRALKTVCPGILDDASSHPRWSLSMPEGAYRDWLKGLARRLVKTLDGVDTTYHTGTFTRTQETLRSLGRMPIDRSKWERFLHMGPDGDINPTVATFEPDHGGLASPLTYDRFGTRTGRLRVSSGPRILTLAKEHRHMLASRFDGGRCVLFDYVSFEAQIARAATGRRPLPDVYDHVRHDVFGGELDRERTKVACLATLFGAGRSTIGRLAGLKGPQLDATSAGLRDYFGVDELLECLMPEFSDGGTVTSRYGRKVRVPDVHRLVNSYVQSTAVDAALLGFGRLIDELGGDGAPLAFIHDALLVDCSPHALSELDMLASVAGRVPGFDCEFPCRVERLVT